MQAFMIDSDRKSDWGLTAFALLLPTVVTVVYFVLLANEPAAWQQGAYLIGKVVQFGFPLAWVLAVRGRRIGWRPPRLGELCEGGALGLVIAGAMVALYFVAAKTGAMPAGAADAIRAKVAGIGVGSPARFFALGVFYALGHSLLEEYYWRWFVFGDLESLVSQAAAVVVSALGFTAHHVVVLALYFGWTSGWTAFLSASVAVGGVLWALLYRRQRSLYGVWLSHLLVDGGIFAIGYHLAFGI